MSTCPVKPKLHVRELSLARSVFRKLVAEASHKPISPHLTLTHEHRWWAVRHEPSSRWLVNHVSSRTRAAAAIVAALQLPVDWSSPDPELPPWLHPHDLLNAAEHLFLCFCTRELLSSVPIAPPRTISLSVLEHLYKELAPNPDRALYLDPELADPLALAGYLEPVSELTFALTAKGKHLLSLINTPTTEHPPVLVRPLELPYPTTCFEFPPVRYFGTSWLVLRSDLYPSPLPELKPIELSARSLQVLRALCHELPRHPLVWEHTLLQHELGRISVYRRVLGYWYNARVLARMQTLAGRAPLACTVHPDTGTLAIFKQTSDPLDAYPIAYLAPVDLEHKPSPGGAYAQP